MITVTPLKRVFVFNGARLPDPGSSLSIEEVRSMYVNTYPELATATIEGPAPVDGVMQYTFVRAIGAKG